MSRFRLAWAATAALAAAAVFFAVPRERAAAQPSCAVTEYRENAVVYHVLFARNGAVQAYQLVQSSHNVERDHDVLKELEAKYGPAGANTPPVKIVSFRTGSGGMMIPDKAVDSCGRVSYFH